MISLRLDGLRLQILGLVILPLSVALLALAVGGVWIHERAMHELVAQRDQRAVDAAAAALANDLAGRMAVLRARAAIGDVRAAPAGDEPLFDHGLAVYSVDGALLAASLQAPFWDGPEAIDLVRRLSDGQSGVVATRSQGDETVAVAAWRSGEAVLAGAFDLGARLSAAFPEAGAPESGLAAYLLDRQGRVLISRGSAPGAALAAAVLPAADEAPTGVVALPGGHLSAYAVVEYGGWLLVMVDHWESGSAPLLKLSLAAPLALAPALLAALIGLWFGAQRVIAPLRRLEQQASRFAEGDDALARQPVGGIAEIRRLQDTLRRMALRIRAARDAMQRYINAITRAQEEERRRLARDLHDQTIQDLIALDQRLQILGLDLAPQSAGSAAQVEALHRDFQQAIQDVRRLTQTLRPSYLEDLGLAPSLEMLARDAQLEAGLPVAFAVEGEPRRLNPEIELAVYRIVQEALRNLTRHGGAQRAGVRITFLPGSFVATVHDDGVGFVVPGRHGDLAELGHFGLMGMHERAELAGARLAIESAPGAGTTVRVEVPTS